MFLFSVIIPTYNRAKELDRCLASLVAQTYNNFEVIIYDDGSSDETKIIVKAYENKLNIKYFWEENWGGPARPRNLAIVQAQSDWICFLDSDDWWYKDKLSACLKYLEQADIIYHDLDSYGKDMLSPIGKFKSRTLKNDIFIDLLTHHNALFNSSVVVRKSILQKINCFSEERKMIGIEDFDCWLKISKITKRFIYIPLSLGAYNAVGGISKTVKHVEKEEALISRWIGTLAGKQKKKVMAALKYRQARIYHLNGFYKEARLSYFLALRNSFWKSAAGIILTNLNIKL